MTSTTTTKGRGSSTRFAAASLLALAMMLSGCSAATDVQDFIADAQGQAEAIEEDLHELTEQVTDVPPELQGSVTDAVASAQAATDEARTALEQAATDEDGAVVALQDAQVALEAASAEVKHVTEQARESGATEVSDLLAQLQEQIDNLRGETEEAAG
jgi:F0F1-type ATP synthase membrane subunit b/b'